MTLVLPTSKAELARLEAEAQRALATQKLGDYIKRMWVPNTDMPEYLMTPMHRTLIGFMELVEAGLIPRLMVEVPPQSGKSEIVTKRFSAWYLGRHPNRHIISISYGDELAWSFSKEVRAQLRQKEWPFTRVAISDDQFAKGHWYTDQGGSYRAAGRETSITGRPANHINVDDPFKNHNEARSTVVRESAWKMYTTTATTRLTKDGSVVVTQTRWDDDDLIGRLKEHAKEGGTQWVCLTMPGLSDSHEVYAKITLPDGLASEAGLLGVEATTCDEILGRLRACVG